MASSKRYQDQLEAFERGSALSRCITASVVSILAVTLGIWKSGLYAHLIPLSATHRAQKLSAQGLSAALGGRAGPAPATPQVLYRSAVTSQGIASSVSRTPERLILTGTILGATPEKSLAFIGIDRDRASALERLDLGNHIRESIATPSEGR